MPTKLNVLILEDRAADAELMLHELRRAGYEPEWKRVETEPDYLAQLDQGCDVILADYALPEFTGLRALQLLKERGLDIPFIIVSGTIGEEKAVAAMKAGANDYVMKERMARLGSAVERELRAAVERRERKRAREALRASEVRYRRLFEAARDGVLILDAASGTVVDVNPFLIKLLGYPREAFLGKTVWELGFLKDLFANQAKFTELQKNEYVRYEDLPLESADGRRIEVEFVSNVYLVDRHKVIQCNIRDISQRRRAEEALCLAHARLRTFVDANIVGVVTANAAGAVIDANDYYLRLIGFTREEFEQGRVDWRAITPPEWLPADEQAIRELRERGTCTPYEKEYVLRDGTRVPVFLADTMLPGPEGHIAAFVLDLTERKHLADQLRQSQKMEAVGQLAGGVAHDFNNLLFIINGRAELAMNKLKADDPLRAQLKLIYDTGVRAANLTRQLLAFSRRQTLQPKILDLNTVVTDMSKILFRLVREDISMKMALCPTLRPTKADPGQIEQILMNLVVNARDAMPKNGTLTIETANVELDAAYCRTHADAKPGHYVVLAVSDTGCGMDDHVKARIFEPFFTTKEPGQGTGLGLATVYGIVKQSDGHIAVYSAVGTGTTFKICLPATAATPARDSHAIMAIVSRGTETILLVEDEAEVRDLAQELLESNGYTVLLANNGIEALAVLKKRKGKIDLIVTDVVMPKMNGPEMAHRASDLCPGIKVLFMSGYTDGAVGSNGVLSVGAKYLQKPFTSGTLARKVREVLDSAAEPSA